MKHAGQAALDAIEPLLAKLRAIPDLRERSRGIFYRKSKAYLHFHEDPTGLFADIKNATGQFDRLRADTPEGQADLLKRAGG